MILTHERRLEYIGLWRTMELRLTPQQEEGISVYAEALLRPGSQSQYRTVVLSARVPGAFVAALHFRECSCDFSKGLFNGDPWNKPTTHWPPNKGPYTSWSASAIAALEYEKDMLDCRLQLSRGRIDELLAFAEAYNGSGYRRCGIRSPYLWAGTNHEEPGLYVADSKFDPDARDLENPGIAALLKTNDTWAVNDSPPLITRGSEPAKISRLQEYLNGVLGEERLLVDGDPGPKTRAAYKEAFGCEMY